jgi:hypothetical protein
MTAGTLVPEALRLPAAPLLAAVDQAAHDRRTSVSDVLGKSGQKAYARARAAGTATLAQVEAVCDRLGCHPYELYGAAYQRLALANGSGPLEPEVTVTAWHLAACTRPSCARPIRPGELVGLVADVGPCCAGCCGLDRSVGSERTSTNMAAGPPPPVGRDGMCLFCERLDGGDTAHCPAFARAGTFAHQACCGCAAWVGWVRPGLPPSPSTLVGGFGQGVLIA